ncbi:hypothetical protein [Aeromonas phage BUCT552]|nr:hypothetical protein [Aeromonas phage BUCT552]
MTVDRMTQIKDLETEKQAAETTIQSLRHIIGGIVESGQIETTLSRGPAADSILARGMVALTPAHFSDGGAGLVEALEMELERAEARIKYADKEIAELRRVSMRYIVRAPSVEQFKHCAQINGCELGAEYPYDFSDAAVPLVELRLTLPTPNGQNGRGDFECLLTDHGVQFICEEV